MRERSFLEMLAEAGFSEIESHGRTGYQTSPYTYGACVSARRLAIVPDKELDTRGEVCPFPWVHAAKALKRLEVGQVLRIVGDHGPALRNIPQNFADAGQAVLRAQAADGIEWEILVRKET